MYVCMYTMILPLHFSVPIYSPWQKKKKKKKNTQKKKRGAGPLPGPESVAKPYGRFGQKLENLQGRSGQGTWQGNTVQDRSWQRDRSKAAEQK